MSIKTKLATFTASLSKTSASCGKALYGQRHFFLQCLGALSVLIGVADYSIPIALIVGGVGAVLVVERQHDESSVQAIAERAQRVVASLARVQATGKDTVPTAAVIKELS